MALPLPVHRGNTKNQSLSERVGTAVNILIGKYRKESQEMRAALNIYPPHDKVLEEEILPIIKDKYSAYLEDKTDSRAIALLLLAGEGGSGTH